MTLANLSYFPGRGRAETTRWMLAAVGVEFANVVIDTPEALASLRASGKLPFDQLPLLEIDGCCLSQSAAMVRFLARRGDLYGDNNTDAMWCDMVAGVVADLAEVVLQRLNRLMPWRLPICKVDFRNLRLCLNIELQRRVRAFVRPHV